MLNELGRDGRSAQQTRHCSHQLGPEGVFAIRGRLLHKTWWQWLLWTGSFLWRGNGTDKKNGGINIISRPGSETLKGWDTDWRYFLSCEREDSHEGFHIQIVVDCTEKWWSLMTTVMFIEEEIYSVQCASSEESDWWQIGAREKKKEIQGKKDTFQLHEKNSWIASSILPNYL